MASAAKRRSKGSKASDGKRKRKNSDSDEDAPAFLSSKYAEPPTSKIYNSRFNHTHPAELFRKDLISAMKLPDSEPLGPDDYWLIEDPWKPEWERGVQVPVDPEALPNPDARPLRKRSKEQNFKLFPIVPYPLQTRTSPKKLIRFTRDSFFNPEVHVMSYTNTLAERTCRYDMDTLDFHWLTSVNQDREDFGLQPLEETFVEQVVEECEVQAYVNFQEAIKSEEGLGVEYDEDAICDVCRSPDSHESNEMVFCDSCNICVHQICYGITKIPEGSWICRTCALGIRPPCVLCPNRGGAMKTTRCGQKWAHVGCAVWIPEVSFFNFVKMEPIVKISQIPASRWSLICTLCNDKSGACISCSEKGCKASFHVTCAFNEGLQMRATVKNTDSDDDVLKAFCQKHGKKKCTIFADSEEDTTTSPSLKDILTSEERANLRQQKIQEKEAEFYNYVNIDEVSEMFQCDKTDIETIFNYWKLKRKANWNRALLTPKIDTENSCSEEDSPISFLKKMVHHRQDLERARNLAYMAIKREKQVKRWMEMKEKIFIKQVDVLRKEGKTLSEDQKQAVLNANFGDMAYDKKFSGMNGPSPNMVSVLTNLVGEEVVKSQINGLMKIPSIKKSDRGKSERTPNPYAKHYLNGLVKRSQRWFPVADKQKKEKKSKLLSSASLQKDNSNQSFSSYITSDHVVSDDGHEASKDKDVSQSEPNSDCISQDSDIKDFSTSSEACTDFTESCSVNGEIIETKESTSASILNDFNAAQSSSFDNHMFNVSEVYDVSEVFEVSEVYDASEVYDTSEVCNLDTLVYPLIELQNNADSLCLDENLTNSLDFADSATSVKLEISSDSESSKCNNGFGLDTESCSLKNDSGLSFSRKSKDEHSKSKSRLLSSKKKICSKTHKNKDADTVSKMPNDCLMGDMCEGKSENCKLENIECENSNVKIDMSDIIEDEHAAKNSDINVSSDASIISVSNIASTNCDIICKNETVLKIETEIEVQNLEIDSKQKPESSSQCNSYDVKITDKHIDVKSILGNSCLKVSLERNLALQIEQNHVKVPPYVLNSENIVNCGKIKNCIPNSKAGRVIKLDDKSSKKTSSVSNDKSTESIVNCDKSSTNSFISKCEDKLEPKFRPVSSKSSPARTQSPTPGKLVDSGTAKFSKSSPKHNSQDKASMPSKSSAPKLKNLSISLSTSSLSVNKRPSSPLTKCHDKAISSPSGRLDDPKDSFFKDKPSEAPLPRKDMLRGYKIPKKPRSGKPEENSLDLKRGSSPLSPLPDITSSSSVSGYHANGKSSWRKLEPRTDKTGSCKWTSLNGDTHQESEERLVVKLKKDMSDPKSQRWLADSSTFNRGGGMPGWIGDFVPNHVPPFPPPFPPPPVRWSPMGNRGGFSQIHRNYRPGPYT